MHDFSFKIFCLTVPKNFVGEHFGVSKFRASQNFMHKKGISLNSVEKSLYHSTEKFRRRTLLCFERILGEAFTKILSHRTEKTSPWNHSVFQKISDIEKNLWIRGGLSRFSVEIFMSHSAENFRKGILQFVRKFLVSKSFMDEKGGITFFRRNILVSQCRKNSWASLQCFRKFGVSKNFMHTGRYHFFRRKFLVSQCRKNSWASLQCFRKFGVSKNFMHTGRYHFFRRNILASQCRKFSWASLKCFRKFGVSENFVHTRRYHFFRRNILVSQCRKTS